MTPMQSMLLAQVVLAAIFMAAFIIEDRRMDEYKSWLKSDPQSKGRFDQWKKDQQNPPRHTPPTN